MSRKFIIAATLVAGVAIVPATGHASGAPYSPLDKYMLQSSIQGDRFEIAGGKLAQSKGTSPAVKALGARLAKDHAASLREAIKLAKDLKIFVPKSPTPSQEWELATLDAMAPASFDAAYAGLEVQDHKQDIDDSKTEVSEGANHAVRHLANKDLPVLRQHLKLSKQALSAH